MGVAPLTFAAGDIQLFLKTLEDVTLNSAKSIDSNLSKLFNVATTDMPREDWLNYAGIPGYTAYTGEGDEITRAAVTERYKTTLTQGFYANAVSYTWKNKRFQKYNLLTEMAQELGRKAVVAKEQLGFNWLNATMLGSDTAYYWNATAAKYLASDTHALSTGSTYDNKMTGALSVTNLQSAVNTLQATPDDTGIVLDIQPKRLFVADNLRFTAIEVLNKGQMLKSGTADNTTNAFNKYDIELIITPYMTDGYWVLQGDINPLLWRESVSLQQRQYLEDKTNITVHEAIFGCAYGARDWRGYVCSVGTG